MDQKGYTSEQLFKLALSKAGLDPRSAAIPIAALDSIARFEAPEPPPESSPEVQDLPPLVAGEIDGNTPVPRIVALQLIGIDDETLAKALKARNLDPAAQILDMATVSAIYEAHSLKRQDALEYLGLQEPELTEALKYIEEDPKAKTLTLAIVERLENLPTETLLETQATAMRSAMDTAQERQLAYYRDLAERLQAEAETAALSLVASSAETFHNTLAEAFDALAVHSAERAAQVQSDLLTGLQPKDETKRDARLGKARRQSFKSARKSGHTRTTAQQIFQRALQA